MTDQEFAKQIHTYLNKITEIGNACGKSVFVGSVLFGKEGADNIVTLSATTDVNMVQGIYAASVISAKIIIDSGGFNVNKKNPWEK